MSEINLDMFGAVMQEKAEWFKSTDRVSELLQIALEDLEMAEQAENVTIDMGLWYASRHAPTGEEKQCEVCLAGSVMRYTLTEETTTAVDAEVCDMIDMSVWGNDNDFDIVELDPADCAYDDTFRRLWLLNEIRSLIEATGVPTLRELSVLKEFAGLSSLQTEFAGLQSYPHLRNISDALEAKLGPRPRTKYHQDPEVFKRNLRKTIEVFKEFDM